MKTKKQRKITIAQLNAVEKKLIVLQHKQAAIVKQVTPLKLTVRKYIQQNMKPLAQYAGGVGMISWAIDKIRRGYFGTDTHLGNLREIIAALKKTGL